MKFNIFTNFRMDLHLTFDMSLRDYILIACFFLVVLFWTYTFVQYHWHQCKNWPQFELFFKVMKGYGIPTRSNCARSIFLSIAILCFFEILFDKCSILVYTFVIENNFIFFVGIIMLQMMKHIKSKWMSLTSPHITPPLIITPMTTH